MLQKSKKVFAPADEIATFSKEMLSFRQLTKYARTLFKSSMIGTFIGVVPGVGEDVAAWSSYAAAKRASKEKELFGKGSVEEAIAALARHRGIIRKKVSEEVILRHAPDLRFRADETYDRMDETRRLFSDPVVQRDIAAKDEPPESEPPEAETKA